MTQGTSCVSVTCSATSAPVENALHTLFGTHHTLRQQHQPALTFNGADTDQIGVAIVQRTQPHAMVVQETVRSLFDLIDSDHDG